MTNWIDIQGSKHAHCNEYESLPREVDTPPGRSRPWIMSILPRVADDLSDASQFMILHELTRTYQRCSDEEDDV